MALLRKWVFIILVFLGFWWPCLEGRMLMAVRYIENSRIAALRQSLILSVLPKGRVPSFSPSRKGKAVFTDEKLIVGHLVDVDRTMHSVPSPGVGH